MPERSVGVIDSDLSKAVKARDSARKQISDLSGVVVRFTGQIDGLLAERSATAVVVCPDTVASLTDSVTEPHRVP